MVGPGGRGLWDPQPPPVLLSEGLVGGLWHLSVDEAIKQRLWPALEVGHGVLGGGGAAAGGSMGP